MAQTSLASATTCSATTAVTRQLATATGDVASGISIELTVPV